VYKDPTYTEIVKKLRKKGIHVIIHTSFIDEKTSENLLKCYYEYLKKQSEDRNINEMNISSDDDDSDDDKIEACIWMDDDDSSEEIKITRRKKKYISPEFIFVFDDISNQLKSVYLDLFLKQGRHFLSKIIISSQYYMDLKKDGRANLDIVCLFKNLPLEKLKDIHKESDLDIDFDLFEQMYRQATSGNYNFFYINTRVPGDYRINFNKRFLIK